MSRSVKRSAHAPARRRRGGQRLCQLLRFGTADEGVLSRISSDQGILRHQQKSPTRHLGAGGMALSREEHGLCGLGGWPGLRLFQPITVAGPRPIHTAFPASLACKLKIECMTRLRDCQCATENGPAKMERLKKLRRCSAIFPVGF